MFAPSISLDTIKVINLEERVKELEEVNNILYKELEIVNTQRFNLAIELADKCICWNQQSSALRSKETAILFSTWKKTILCLLKCGRC